MRGLRAALYKDLRLQLRGGGMAAVLLPLLLILALRAGAGAVSGGVDPFPIAVRDLDGTFMSRSLITQVMQIQLFSQVEVLGEDERDSDALDRGAAAVITIPKDFFYDMYTMSDCPVDVALNSGRKLEASLLSSILTSVLDIVRADQAAQRGVYRFCYGEITEDLEKAMFAETAENLFRDALGRQRVFDSAAELSDTGGALQRRLEACVLSLLVLFFAIAALRTLPEERDLGVLPRYRAAGGGLWAFVLSKFLTAVLLLLPGLALIGLTLPVGGWALLATAGALLFGAFGLLLALAAWSRNATAFQRRGNLLLLLSLVTGGVLWPSRLLPPALAALGKLTLPHWALMALESAWRGGEVLPLLEPALAMGMAGILLSLAGLPTRHGGRKRIPPPASRPLPAGETSVPLRLARLAGWNLKAMAGGPLGLGALLLVSLLCGGVAAGVEGGGTSALSIAVCDLDGSELSQDLTARLERQEGLALTLCDEQGGRQLLLSGEAEGLLTIGSGYGAGLEAAESLPLRYQSSSSAVSAQGAREIVAGQAAVQRSRLRAAALAGERLGRPLEDQEAAQLMAEIDAAEAGAPLLWRLQWSGGAAGPDPFLPDRTGFAALASLLALFTAAPWSGSQAKRISARMSSLPWGRLLFHTGGWLALAILGCLTYLAVLLPGGLQTAWDLAAAAGFALCGAALAQLLARLNVQEGRMDALAPFAALILCLLGGCFLDLRGISPDLARLMVLTPAGLARMASEGSGMALAVLIVTGSALSLLGFPRKS